MPALYDLIHLFVLELDLFADNVFKNSLLTYCIVLIIKTAPLQSSSSLRNFHSTAHSVLSGEIAPVLLVYYSVVLQLFFKESGLNVIIS